MIHEQTIAAASLERVAQERDYARRFEATPQVVA